MGTSSDSLSSFRQEKAATVVKGCMCTLAQAHVCSDSVFGSRWAGWEKRVLKGSADNE